MHSHEWSSCFIDSLRIVELFFLKKTLFRDQLSSSRKMGQHDEWDEVGFWEFFKAAKTVYVCVYLYIYIHVYGYTSMANFPSTYRIHMFICDMIDMCLHVFCLYISPFGNTGTCIFEIYI